MAEVYSTLGKILYFIERIVDWLRWPVAIFASLFLLLKILKGVWNGKCWIFIKSTRNASLLANGFCNCCDYICDYILGLYQIRVYKQPLSHWINWANWALAVGVLKRHSHSFKNSPKFCLGIPLNLRKCHFAWFQKFSIPLISFCLSANNLEWLIR